VPHTVPVQKFKKLETFLSNEFQIKVTQITVHDGNVFCFVVVVVVVAAAAEDIQG
jgi:hypothetical protein